MGQGADGDIGGLMAHSGIQLGLTSRLCIKLHRLASWCVSRRLSPLARTIQILNRLLTGADIDCRATLDAGVLIPHTVGLVVGETTIIEGGVVLMPHVTLGAREHDREGRRHPWLKQGAYIGAGAVVIGPVTVGENAVVGANSVVTRDVESGSTVVGIPAKALPSR